MRARAGIGDPGAGVARRRNDDDFGPVGSSTERALKVVGGNAPRVRRQIDQRIDQRSAGALPYEIADQAVGVHPVGGPEIDHAENRLGRKRRRRGQGCGVGRRERVAL